MATRASSPVFVGREGELARVREALDGLAEGHPAVFLVTGEAGVGKTRFLHEVAIEAGSRGYRVLEGGCVGLGSENLPYAPLIEALRGLPEALAADRLDTLVAKGAPELAHVMPGLAVEADQSDRMSGSQGQVFEQILLFLRRLAALDPLVLMIEDIHWADRTTFEFLLFLLRNLRDDAIAVFLTHRSDDLDRHDPLASALVELKRSARAGIIALPRLDRREIAAVVGEIQGAPPAPGLIDTIFTRSDGNALFAEELLAAGDRGRLPTTLQELLLARAAGLSDPTRRLIRVASVAGQRLDPGLLVLVSGDTEDAIDTACREALNAHVLAVDAAVGGRLTFRHALMRDAIYEDLLPSERSRLHAAFARAIDPDDPDADPSRTAELAYHWQAAGDLPRAFEASVRAGLAAEAIYAHADASRNYELALALWDRIPDAAIRSPIDRVDLLTRAALTSMGSLHTNAIDHLRAAIVLVDPASDPGRAGLLRAWLASALWFTDRDQALAVGRESLAIVPAEPPTAERARTLGQFAATLTVLDRHADSLAVIEEALRTIRAASASSPRPGVAGRRSLDATDPRRVESLALELLGSARAALGDVDEGLRLIEASRAMAIETGIPNRINEGWIAESTVLREAGRFEEALVPALEGAAHAAEHGMASAQGSINLCFAALALEAAGRWDDAARRFSEAERSVIDAMVASALDCEIAPFEVERGEFASAKRRLSRQRRDAELTHWAFFLAPFTTAEAEMALWQDRPGEARSIIASALPRLESAPDIWIGHLGPIYMLGIWAEAAIAHLARSREDQSDLEQALAAGRALLAAMAEVAADTAARRPAYAAQAEACLATCHAEASRLEGRRDVDLWSAAAAAWERFGMPYPRAYALMRAGEAALAGRDREHAVADLRSAVAIAKQLGAEPLLAAAKQLLARVGLAAEPQAVRGRYDLTPRELEVLGLLAAGRSDGEIATSLFISKKTVSVHLNNIRGKLGADTRVQIVTLALAQGLVHAPQPADARG